MKDIYVYTGTPVLINKLGIQDGAKLDEKENALVALNLTALLAHPLTIRTVFDIKAIHKFLFSDLYDWAGENRKVNIYKDEPVLGGLSVTYSDYRNIDADLRKLDIHFQGIEWKELSKQETIDAIVVIVSKLWRIHCFREGNTRTVTTFLYLFMRQIKLKVNVDFIGRHAKFFRNALVLASIDQYSEYEHLTNILMDSISLQVPETGKYKTIRDYEVDKYEYRSHQYKD